MFSGRRKTKNQSGGNMLRQGENSGVGKKKRRSSGSSNIENVPTNAEKKTKLDNSRRLNDDQVHLTTDERIPFADLLHRQSGKDKNITDLTDSTGDLSVFENAEVDESNLESSEFLDDEFFMTNDFQPQSSTLLTLDAYSFDPSCSINNRNVNWPNESADIWNFYRSQSENTTSPRSINAFEKHPSLKPRMRSVLLEWIFEVCDVYKLHRETYYLTIDYLDRYLNASKNISKNELQLIGVTCLLIAAKYEEIYPPKVNEFAYITDGACSEEEIIKMEMVIIRALDWKCLIISANNWLSVFLQLIYHKSSKAKSDLMIPQFSIKTFKKVSQLLDLSSLDEGFLNFSYKTSAATALYLAYSDILALSISGFELAEINKCVEWMGPFWKVLQELNGYESSHSPIPPGRQQQSLASLDFSYGLIKHNVSLELLEAGKASDEKSISKQAAEIEGLLTPPSSSKKILHTQIH